MCPYDFRGIRDHNCEVVQRVLYVRMFHIMATSEDNVIFKHPVAFICTQWFISVLLMRLL